MILSVGLAMTAALAAGVSAPAGDATTASAPRPCCFTHTAYVGVCSVVPAEKETCEDILAYLNSPSSVGRTYCNNTRIRGNWKNVPCPPAAPAPSATSASDRCAARRGDPGPL